MYSLWMKREATILCMMSKLQWTDWTVKLSANDILYTIPWRGKTQFGDLFIDGRGGSDSRTFQFYVSYAFGNKDVKTKNRRKSGLEDEQDRIN